jgi:hypothetical protein
MADYFYLEDLNVVARMENGKSYIFDAEKEEWVADTGNLVATHMGTDGETSGRVRAFTEEEAQTEIGRADDNTE